MDLEALLKEIGANASLATVHPVKLDRWHRGLFELPEALYMQLSCDLILRQVVLGTEALRAMIKIVGVGNLPLSHTEVARRKVGQYVLHVPALEQDPGTWPFKLIWDAGSTSWRITAARAEGITKSVPTLEKAVEKAVQWAADLEAQLRETAEEVAAAPEG
jgi:hypothetical protein